MATSQHAPVSAGHGVLQLENNRPSRLGGYLVRAIRKHRVQSGALRTLALRQGHFLDAVDRHIFAGQATLVAQPARALLDLYCLRKLEVNGLSTLAQSLRIDADLLRQMPTTTTWQTLLQVYSHQRMSNSIQALQREMAT